MLVVLLLRSGERMVVTRRSEDASLTFKQTEQGTCTHRATTQYSLSSYTSKYNGRYVPALVSSPLECERSMLSRTASSGVSG